MSEAGKVFQEFKRAGDIFVAEGGMTMWQFYFGQALVGILSNPNIINIQDAEVPVAMSAITSAVNAARFAASEAIRMEEEHARTNNS